MRRSVLPSILAATLLLAGVPGHAQRVSRSGGPAPAQVRRGGPPHAWLFGRWTGGLFPVLPTALAQACRTDTTVVFGQDGVAHSTLLGSTPAQRVIETVRTSPAGAEFRFTPDAADADGFGCPDPNVLNVQRISADEVAFPNCKAFPYPLKRCPAG